MHDSLFSKSVSDVTLERYALRELPAGEMREIEARLAGDAVLRERLRTLLESNAAILRAAPPELFAQRVQALQRALDRKAAAEDPLRRPARAASGAWSFGAWKPLLGGLALLTILAVPIGLLGPRPGIRPIETVGEAQGPRGTEGAGQSSPATFSPSASAVTSNPPSATPATDAAAETPIPSSEETVRLKGLEPHLAIFRKTDSGSEPVRPGEKAGPGEVLRIGYQAAGFPYGAILSVDGNGSVTRHWPTAGQRAGRLETGDALLPSSFELDAAPDYERFYFVVSDKPFELDPLLESLHKNESLPATGKDAGTEKIKIVRFEILKERGI